MKQWNSLCGQLRHQQLHWSSHSSLQGWCHCCRQHFRAGMCCRFPQISKGCRSLTTTLATAVNAGKRGESEGGAQPLPGTLENSQPLLIQLLSDLSRGPHLPSARKVLLSCSWVLLSCSWSTFTQLDAGSGIYPCEQHSQPTAKWRRKQNTEVSLWRERGARGHSFCSVCPWVWNSPTLLLQLQPDLQLHVFLLSGVPTDLELLTTIKARPALDKPALLQSTNSSSMCIYTNNHYWLGKLITFPSGPKATWLCNCCFY